MEENNHKLWHFHGGLKLNPHKKISTGTPLRRVPPPDTLTLPTHQHIGDPAEVLVKVGDRVNKGQLLARANGYISARVHASSSGTVVEVGQRPVPHPSGMNAECIVIDTDGRDDWGDSRLPAIDDYTALSPASLRSRVRECGIVGLGGAAFPTSVKLNPLPHHTIDTLIINGVECEPYITCDDTLIRERAGDLIESARILRHAMGNPECILAIESDMPAARDALWEALGGEQADGIRVAVVPTIYPSGSEKQLIRVLTGREVPAHGLPHDVGLVCQNVGTAYAVYRAVRHGEPLLERIVTVTGRGVEAPCNLEVLLGTPVAEVIATAGGYTPSAQRLIMGGPMMGIALQDDIVPVVKATNCLLVASASEIDQPQPMMPCIRCGECARVCPAALLPQELYRHAKNREFDRVQEFNLFDCIECGCCAYVCPSRLPLVHYYRFAKSEIGERERERKASDLARRRFEFRQERLEREKLERAERQARKRAKVASKASAPDKKAAIDAAVERSRARREQRSADESARPDVVEQQSGEVENTDQIHAREQ
ncbi:MAG: electron transport complex subunit RsxC [Gammaproteobacteria bacterium]|jgi:electron transport complex protein RnfC|nr:electron transport complex subunit RsxC [Gammaproteobacteria bacterium]